MIRIGVLGAAPACTRDYLTHLRAISDVDVIGLASPEVERGQQIASEFEIAPYAETEALLDQAPDGVVVCAAVGQQPRLVEQAAGTTRHILCEVPLTPTLERARAVLKACEARGSLLQPAFPLRFAPVFKTLKQLLDERKLGQLLSIKTMYHTKMPTNRPGGEGTEGGAIFLRAPHIIDLLRWLSESDITDVYAEIGTSLLHPGVECDDVGLLSVSLANGAYATIDVSAALPEAYPVPEVLKMEIIGDEGSVRVDAFRQNVDLYGDGVIWASWGSNPTLELLLDFVDGIRSNRTPVIKTSDALRAQEVTEAAYRSATSGTPVILSSR